MDDDSKISSRSRHLEHPDEFGVDAESEEVSFAGFFDVAIFLTEDGKNAVGVGFEFVDEVHTRRPSHENGCHYARKQHEIACGQDGHHIGCGCIEKCADVAFVVGNHLY